MRSSASEMRVREHQHRLKHTGRRINDISTDRRSQKLSSALVRWRAAWPGRGGRARTWREVPQGFATSADGCSDYSICARVRRLLSKCPRHQASQSPSDSGALAQCMPCSQESQARRRIDMCNVGIAGVWISRNRRHADHGSSQGPVSITFASWLSTGRKSSHLPRCCPHSRAKVAPA